MSEQVRHGDGYDDEPMRAHDVSLVEAEAQHHVDEQVEAKKREGEPEKAAAAACPHTEKKEQEDEGFHDVVEGKAIVHDDGAVAQHVFEQMVVVQLDGLAQNVFYQTPSAWRADVCPL